MTIREAAQETGLSEKTIRRRIKDLTIRAKRCGKSIRIPRSEIERFMAPVNNQHARKLKDLERYTHDRLQITFH